jgi:hypothetical protein
MLSTLSWSVLLQEREKSITFVRECLELKTCVLGQTRERFFLTGGEDLTVDWAEFSNSS